jgi:hypothetical protein
MPRMKKTTVTPIIAKAPANVLAAQGLWEQLIRACPRLLGQTVQVTYTWEGTPHTFRAKVAKTGLLVGKKPCTPSSAWNTLRKRVNPVVTPANGWMVWKDVDGKSLDALYRAYVEGGV